MYTHRSEHLLDPHHLICLINFNRISTMKKLIVIITLIIFSASAKNTNEKHPFSVNALKYLLERKEYDRFDFYISSYLRQHPDTAVLHLLQGYRYFEEARCYPSREVYRREHPTGGIPRKYPKHFVTPLSHRSAKVKVAYDKDLVDKAFAAMRKARFYEPEREDIYLGLCHMAVESNQPEVVAYEIKRYIQKFGKSEELATLVSDYSRKQDVSADNNEMVTLLNAMQTWYPDNSDITAELGKYYYDAGILDSAYYFIMRALDCDKDNPRVYEHAIRLASSKGNFAKACSLSLHCYSLSDNILYLEQAALYALTFDSTRAVGLYNKIVTLPGYVDSLSIIRDIFRDYLSDPKAEIVKKFFAGELFHCNFPLFEIRYKRDRDKVSYYQYKASAFYAYAMYDSAAYYNLNLLRSISYKDKQVAAALFNLAAEYYALGKYSLSYHRFLDLCRFYKGGRDVAVRYALGLNCEQFGDLTNARRHYRYVIRHPNKQYNTTYQLQDLASTRLKEIGKDSVVSYR